MACALALGPALVSAPARAEVKTRVRADGTIEIYNEGASNSLDRAPLRLKPIPRADFGDWIREHSALHGVDPRLVQAIVQVESGYNPRAVSRKGAVGLMQLMPGTAKDLQVGNRYNPEQNIRGGIAYLRQMIDLFAGRLELAIAAYNAGPGAVQKHKGVPPFPDTRDYVDRVLTLYRGSSPMLGFASDGAPLRLNGLLQSLMPSPLQQALANGLLRTAQQPTGGTVMATASPLLAAASGPVAASVVPAAQERLPRAPASSAPPPATVLPATAPVVVEPAPAQPATGG